MGKYDKIAKFLGIAAKDAEKVSPEALALLQKYDTPEVATKLIGDERMKYLGALDSIYGPSAERAKNLGFDPNTKYYHGTPYQGIDAFDPSLTGKGSNSGMEGVFFTPKKSYAQKYGPDVKFGGTIGAFADASYGQRAEHGLDKLLERNESAYNALFDKIEPILKEEKAYSVAGYLDGTNVNQTVKDEINAALNKINIDPYKGDLHEVYLKNKKINPKTFNADAQELPGNAFKNHDTIRLDSEFGPEVAVRDANQIRSTNAAFDPRFKKSGLVMAGAGAVPSVSEQMNPLPFFKNAASAYSSGIDKIYDKLASEMDLTKDKSAKEGLKTGMKLALDPINLIPGAAGLGAGAMQMLGDEKDDSAWKSLKDYLK